MERDWFDDYLDALGDPGQKMHFPPDPPSNQRGAKQRLIFDAAASYEAEMRTRIQATRYELERHSGDSAYEIIATANYLVYSPSTQTILYTTAGGFGGTSSTVTLAAFQAVPDTTPASIALSGTPVITTITGLKYYTNLVSLNIANQGKLAVASLSANTFPSTLVDLNLSNNALTSPDVNNGTAFRTKIAQIKYLDLSQNNFSLTFTFGSNTNLVTLSLSGNKSTPSSITINSNNNLRSINLDNVLCSNIVVSNNVSLSSLSLSGTGTGGATLDCNTCNLSTLNVSNYTSTLNTLNCHINKIKTLDCSPFSSLVNLNCYVNSLTSLTLPNAGGSLSNLYCYSNKLSALNLNKSCLANVNTIQTQSNALTGLDLSVVASSTSLANLNFNSNKLTSASLDTMIAALDTAINNTFVTGVVMDFSGTGNASITNPTTLSYISDLQINFSCSILYNP